MSLFDKKDQPPKRKADFSNVQKGQSTTAPPPVAPPPDLTTKAVKTHTVVSGDEVFKLRLTPSGVLYPHITSVIGNGVVVNPVTLIDELDMLAARGIDVSRVRVSRSAHVIMPYHIALDRSNESRLGKAAVGRNRSQETSRERRVHALEELQKQETDRIAVWQESIAA